MGNVRNPVGPLPSSIYWRRRAVVLCLFAVVIAIAVWVLAAGGGGGSGAGSGGTGAQGPGGHSRTPLPSITPGPTTSQTGITTMPGGRSDGGSSDGGSSDAGADNGGAGDGGSDAGTTAGGTGGGSTRQLPAGSSLPDCGASQVRLTLRSVKSSYGPGAKPQFDVSAVNSGGNSCKVNFSAVSAVVTVTDSSGHHVWSSGDCPNDRSAFLVEAPADGFALHVVPWNLTVSAPQCATPAGNRAASPGTYLAKVALPGLGSAQTSFVLSHG